LRIFAQYGDNPRYELADGELIDLEPTGVLTKIEERQCEGSQAAWREMMKIVTFQISPDDFRQT
jgi:hypothetical protein